MISLRGNLIVMPLFSEGWQDVRAEQGVALGNSYKPLQEDLTCRMNERGTVS